MTRESQWLGFYSKGTKMENMRAALIDMGEHLPIDLDYLTRKLNSLQSSFLFSHETSITSDRVGKPDLELQWYYSERLFDLLRQHPQYTKFDYLVGVTHARITSQNLDEGDIGNKDYFSLSDHRKVSIISLNNNVLAFNSPSKNIYQYMAFCLISELIDSMAGENLFHTENNHCLFDECVDRTAFSLAIEGSQICVQCMAHLKTKGIGDREIKETLRVLKWCRRNTGTSSLLVRTLKNPLTSLAIGTSLGWFSRTLIQPAQFMIIVGILVFTSIAVASYYIYSDYQRNKLTYPVRHA